MNNSNNEPNKKPNQNEENPNRKEKPNKTFGNEPPIKDPLKPKHPDHYEVIGKKDETQSQ